MQETTFEILPKNPDLFIQYEQTVSDIQTGFDRLSETAITPDNFKFYTSVSVISSSRIEGETLEVDSYVKHKMQGIEYLPNLTEKPNDLFEAYQFAQKNSLDKNNFLKAHTLLTQHLLPEKDRGTCRKNEMLVMEYGTNRIQYEAAPTIIVAKEFDKLWVDIENLMKADLAIKEVFYFASLIHLVFVNIHPFNDGNGRAARLLEKWFLAEKLGEKSWYISSEKYYYQHASDYYRNLAVLGLFYEQLNYSKAIPFLSMLPQSLIFEHAG